MPRQHCIPFKFDHKCIYISARAFQTLFIMTGVIPFGHTPHHPIELLIKNGGSCDGVSHPCVSSPLSRNKRKDKETSVSGNS